MFPLARKCHSYVGLTTAPALHSVPRAAEASGWALRWRTHTVQCRAGPGSGAAGHSWPKVVPATSRVTCTAAGTYPCTSIQKRFRPTGVKAQPAGKAVSASAGATSAAAAPGRGRCTQARREGSGQDVHRCAGGIAKHVAPVSAPAAAWRSGTNSQEHGSPDLAWCFVWWAGILPA